MNPSDIDDVDRAILHALQEDARHNTNAAISERVGVSASTVCKRISVLEDKGIIDGYQPKIDYEQAGFPLHVLFICSSPITDREDLIKQALEIEGVVNVRELMTGNRNVHIQVTGGMNDDITHIAHTIDEMGFEICDEILMREEYNQALDRFQSSTS